MRLEIKELIEKGESEILEFKEKFDKENIETAVAFSNSKGGVILIGISDRGEIKGVSVGKETLKEWVNKISQSTEPTLIPEIETYVIEGKTVVAITIKQSPLFVWSPGKLPLGITLEDLYKPHTSVLRNKLIAQLFFDIGFIERWGTGIERMINACKNQELPEPKFEEYQGFRVIFRKDIYTEEYLRSLGLNERQINAIKFVKDKGKLTNKDYQDLFSVSKQTATRDLSHLVELSILQKIGQTGKGTYYILASKGS